MFTYVYHCCTRSHVQMLIFAIFLHHTTMTLFTKANFRTIIDDLDTIYREATLRGNIKQVFAEERKNLVIFFIF
jgi:hypothetical protein